MVKDTFKKKDLINNLSLKTGFSNNLSKKIINDFSKNIKSEVISMSTLEKKSVSKIKAKLISYAS